MFQRMRGIGLMAFTLLATSGFAEVNSTAGLANPLDNAGGGARAVGMGSAFVGVADDSSALLWNPAGLSGLNNVELALHHNSWLAGIIQETAVAALPLGPLGGLGLSLSYVNYGSFPAYDNTGTQVGDYTANRYGLGLGWGIEVLPGLSAGAALKGSMQNLGGDSYSAISADLGALWTPAPGLRLGLSYANLGPQVSGNSQASTLRAGGSYGFDTNPGNHLLLALSGAFEPRGVSRLQAGLEDVINRLIALRLGYQASLAETRVEGLSGLSAGAGLILGGLKLDYACLPYGDLGLTQRLSLSFEFGQPSAGK